VREYIVRKIVMPLDAGAASESSSREISAVAVSNSPPRSNVCTKSRKTDYVLPSVVKQRVHVDYESHQVCVSIEAEEFRVLLHRLFYRRSRFRPFIEEPYVKENPGAHSKIAGNFHLIVKTEGRPTSC